MNSEGGWIWDQNVAERLSLEKIKDLCPEVLPLAADNMQTLVEVCPPGANQTQILQFLTASRLSLHLREIVFYLQLQTWGRDLPAIEETRLEPAWPCLILQKHHLDALDRYFAGQELYDANLRRKAVQDWTCTRHLGIIPSPRWEDNW